MNYSIPKKEHSLNDVHRSKNKRSLIDRGEVNNMIDDSHPQPEESKHTGCHLTCRSHSLEYRNNRQDCGKIESHLHWKDCEVILFEHLQELVDAKGELHIINR